MAPLLWGLAFQRCGLWANTDVARERDRDARSPAPERSYARERLSSPGLDSLETATEWIWWYGEFRATSQGEGLGFFL